MVYRDRQKDKQELRGRRECRQGVYRQTKGPEWLWEGLWSLLTTCTRVPGSISSTYSVLGIVLGGKKRKTVPSLEER